MSAWTPELKAKAKELYLDRNPTAENSIEIVSEIAEEISTDEVKFTSNGVRMVLIQEGVYVKKDPTAAKSDTKKADGEGSKRVSKESQIAALKAAIEAKGKDVDEDILSKLTGKAAAYFVEVLK